MSMDGFTNGEYSMKMTYEGIRSVRPAVQWHKTVWFTNRNPKHSFIIKCTSGVPTGPTVGSGGVKELCLLSQGI